MPWKQTSVLSERMRLVERYALGEESLAELSRFVRDQPEDRLHDDPPPRFTAS